MSVRTSRIGLGLVLAAAASCGEAANPPPPDWPAFEAPPFPDPPETRFEALPAPGTPPVLRWNFPRGRLHSYRLRHETRSTLAATIDGREESRTSRTREEGHVDFRGTGDGPAAVEYKLTLREHRVQDRPQDVNARKPAVFTGHVSDDGRVTDATVVQGTPDPLLLETLFALPERPPAPGAVEERVIDRRAREGRPGQKGTMRISLLGYGKVDRYACARLLVEIDVELSGAGGESRGRSRGRLVSSFAYGEGRFVHVDGTVATRLQTRARVRRKDGSAAWSLAAQDSVTGFEIRLGS